MPSALDSSEVLSDTRDILIIDDSDEFRELLKLRLNEFSFASIYEVDRGEAGRLVFFQLKPDLIFLDLELPDCNGLTILPQLAAAPWKPLIIVVSALVGNIDRDRILRLGAVDIIPKPLSREEFEACMSRHLPARS